jgi:DNA-binding LytR/AlgR family response regulator
MFKVKSKTKNLQSQLNLPDVTRYEVVITDDKSLMEDDKVNLVFPLSMIHEAEILLPILVMKEPVYFSASNERGTTRVEAADIYFIESFGDDIHIHTANATFRTSERLYQIEEDLKHKDFVRISKSVIVSIAKIKYINPALNAKLKLELLNGQELEVNRTYVSSFRTALSI